MHVICSQMGLHLEVDWVGPAPCNVRWDGTTFVAIKPHNPVAHKRGSASTILKRVFEGLV